MKIDRYQAYKDSGIEWLSEVPEHWKIKRIKDFSSVVRGGSPRPAGDLKFYEGDIPFLKVGDLTANEEVYLSTHTHTIKEAGLTNTRFIPKNTLLLTNSGATLGIPKICTFPTTFNDGIAAFIYLNKIDKIFLFYILKNHTKYYLNQAALGQGQPNLNTDIIGNTFICFPPLSEQKSIAHYLDTATAKIDRKIDLLTQKATQYGNLKQSIINEAVTRGLDRSVVMKDSGIEAVGDVPEHWKIMRIKEVAFINKRTLTEKTPKDYEFDYIDIGSITYGVKGFASEHMTFDNAPSRAKRIVKRGDTIISTVRTYLKAITSIDEDVSDLIVSTGFAVISPRRALFSKYFSYISTSSFIVEKICALSTGVSYPATNSSVIADLLCLIPPLSEQKAIADYLDTKTTQIDQIIQTINTQIEKLKELRKTLINDVVTGKIKVV